MQVIPLSEGSFTIDKSKIFVPFNEASDVLQSRPAGSLLVEVQPFVVLTGQEVMLLDTGLGFPAQGGLQLLHNLQKNGIEPGQVTRVLLTHLHKDHAGGVSKRNRFGNYELAFPNAVYYVQENELSYALDTGFPSYMSEEIAPLYNNPQVQLLNGSGSIDGFIHYELTGAHSPYHQVYRIERDNTILFFGGDDAPQLQQMKSRFAAKYDFDGKKAMQLRQQWWQEGLEKGWTFLFYHDIKTPSLKRSIE